MTGPLQIGDATLYTGDALEVLRTLPLGERTYHCEACGLIIDRDLNAALNLKALAVSSTVSACRPGSSGLGHTTFARLLVGQEPSRSDQPCRS